MQRIQELEELNMAYQHEIKILSNAIELGKEYNNNSNDTYNTGNLLRELSVYKEKCKLYEENEEKS